MADDRQTVVLLGGLPGDGVLDVGVGVADATGWPLVHSTTIRRELAGPPHGSEWSAEWCGDVYSEEWTRRTYDELIERTGEHLDEERSVVAAASWRSRELRERIERVAGADGALTRAFRCEATAEAALLRLQVNVAANQPPAAGPHVRNRMREVFDRWPQAAMLETSTGDAIDVAVGTVVASLRSGAA